MTLPTSPFATHPVSGCPEALDLVLVRVSVHGIAGHVTEVLESQLVHGEAGRPHMAGAGATRRVYTNVIQIW